MMRLNKKKILIVEDELKIRNVISMYLKREGYETFETDNGIDALSLAAEEKPGLIVLDIMLPRLSGYDVCRALKSNEDTKNICIIILSAKGQEWEKSEGYQVGADYYETKPFSPKQLIDKIKSLLDSNNGAH